MAYRNLLIKLNADTQRIFSQRPNITAYSKVINNKLQRLNNWYTKVIGLDELKQCQEKIYDAQDNLFKIQEKRRTASVELHEIRNKINAIHEEIFKLKRWEEPQKFLDLTREETEMLKVELETSNLVSHYDQQERELFISFSNALRDNHEKERLQREHTKYLSIILSIAGTFVGASLSMVLTNVKANKMKEILLDAVDTKFNKDGITDALIVLKTSVTKLTETIESQKNSVNLENKSKVADTSENHNKIPETYSGLNEEVLETESLFTSDIPLKYVVIALIALYFILKN